MKEEFYLGTDDTTVFRAQDGWRGKYKKHDVVTPYILVRNTKDSYFGVHVPKTRTSVSMSHLLTMLRGINIPDDHVIDHYNGDTTDNSRSNLRVVLQRINAKNSVKSKNNTSGHTGINWNASASSYTVRKYIRGVRLYIGSRKTLEDAVELLNEYKGVLTADGYTDRHGR